MPMRIDDKKVAVEGLQEIANKAFSAVAADYHGTSVSELTALRQEARESEVHLKVIRNTLAKKDLSDTDPNIKKILVDSIEEEGPKKGSGIKME